MRYGSPGPPRLAPAGACRGPIRRKRIINMQDAERNREFCLYVVVIAATLVVWVNPLTIRLLPWVYGRTVYVTAFDALLLASLTTALMHIRTRQAWLAWISAAILLLVPLMLFSTELVIADHLARTTSPGPDDYYIRNVHVPDADLGWRTVRTSTGEHFSRGNFSVRYQFDEAGRKIIIQPVPAPVTLHVFGDSFAFGHGVSNRDTALQILADRLAGRANVQNYAVMGYGLEQMFVRLYTSGNEIHPGDVVVFLPTAVDIERNLIHKRYVCEMYYSAREQRAGMESISAFPVVDERGWHAVGLEEACGRVTGYLLFKSDLLFGSIYKLIWERQTRERLRENGQNILDQAREFSESKGAAFLTVLVARPSECIHKHQDVDWTWAGGAVIPLLRFCPSNAADVAQLRFPSDGHLSLAGNRWLADSLYTVLRERGIVDGDRSDARPGDGPRSR